MSRAPAAPAEGVAHSGTAVITVGNVVSRLTGFVRVLAVAGALGTTFLGNTYQTSNLVSNVLFELLAAGLLSSVLVPVFVDLLEQNRREEAERLAGALLGVCLAVLGLLAVAGMVGSRWVMRGLTVAVADPEVREAEIRLGSFLLWFFLPQLALYAWGAVSTAVLHGSRRFAVPAFAPVANNVVVTVTMVAFWALRSGSGRSELDVSTGEKALLALGTTAGVLAMTLAPVLAARRGGVRIRPRWEPRHPGLRPLRRQGAWAAGLLALNQLLVGLTVVLANRVPGGVVAYHMAFTFFLLPHAVLAHPISTTLYPTLAASALARRWDDFASAATRGLRVVCFLVLPATALLVALGDVMLRVLEVGALDADGTRLVARVLSAYALGLAGYSAFYLLTRAAYAAGDVATPTVIGLVVTVAAGAGMLGGFALSRGGDRVVVMALVHSAAMTVAAVALGTALAARLHRPLRAVAGVARPLVGAIAAGIAASALAGALQPTSRLAAAGVLVLAVGAAATVFAGSQWLLRAPEWRDLRVMERP